MSKNNQFNNQSVIFQVETTYGTAETVSAAAILFVDNFSPTHYTGDEEDLEVMCKDGGARNKRLITKNQHSEFSFGLPITFPETAGTLASWASVLRACNLDATTDTDNVTFTPSATDSADSGTMRQLIEYGATKDHEFLSTGCRGQVDLVLEHQARPRFEVSNMMGSYNTPDLAPFVTVDCDSVSSNLAENLSGSLVNEISLAGVEICAKSVKINNLGGAVTSRDGFLCAGGDQTMLEEEQITIEISFENTDWATDVEGDRVEFNVFEIGETHGALATHPFVFDCGEAGSGIKYEVTKVQATKPEIEETAGGRIGAKLTLRCLSTPVLTIY